MNRQITSIHRRLRYLPIVCAALFSLVPQSVAQSLSVNNVRFEVMDSVVVLRYDLLTGEVKNHTVEDAALGRDYRIDLLLKKESEPEFIYRPEKVTGDVGTVNTAGRDKTIVWNIREEFPGGVDDNDFYFEIALIPPVSNGPPLYVWLGTGALLAATGIVTYFIISDEKKNDPLPGKFPPPPGRPE